MGYWAPSTHDEPTQKVIDWLFNTTKYALIVSAVLFASVATQSWFLKGLTALLGLALFIHIQMALSLRLQVLEEQRVIGFGFWINALISVVVTGLLNVFFYVALFKLITHTGLGSHT
jgi:hypothetical protein